MLKTDLLPEDKNKVGYYIIHDSATAATYSGSGVLGDRYNKHKLALERGRINNDVCTCGKSRAKCVCRHFNPKLQAVYNKNPDGLELIAIPVEEPGLTREENRAIASILEQEDIDTYSGNSLFLNIAKDTSAPRFGAIVTDETKLRQSLAHQLRYANRTEEEKQLAKANAVIRWSVRKGIVLNLEQALNKVKENNQKCLLSVEYKKTEEYKEKLHKFHSDRIKKLWEDPLFKERQNEKLKKLWENKEFRKKRTDQLKKQWEDPIFKTKQSAIIKDYWKDPLSKKLQSERSKEQWKIRKSRKET
jgi:hypothetical protein